MTYYTKNIRAIEANKDYFNSKLKENCADQNPNKLEQIQMLATLDGNSTINLTLNSNVFRLNSLYNPEHEAKRWVQQFDMKNIGIVISMFGLGNGICVREIIKKLNGKGFLFIYEPSPDLFFYVLEHYDISDILSAQNVSITVEGINDNEIKNMLSNYIDWVNLKSQIICIHPQYDEIFLNSLRTFHKILQDNINRTVVNKNTDIAISELTINNTLMNMKYIKNANIVTDLRGKYSSEIPAIIVAAGPSLDKNIEDLKKAKGRAVIFAVDTAMKYLLAHDIEPDFIVTLDPGKALHHLDDVRCSNIPMFCRIDSRPENIESNKKKILLYNLEGYIKNIYNRLGKDTGDINSGGSVATGAFSICETIGFKRIILVGQDLAYAGESTHAGGISVDVSGAGSHIEIVEDIYGNPIKTRYDWYVYIRWFEDAVDLFNGEEVIDATEGGAKINGTTILTLREAIDKYCKNKVECDRIISELKPTIDDDRLEIARRDIEQDIIDLDEIKIKVHEAVRLSETLIQKYEKSFEETRSSILKNQRLSEINSEIEGKVIYELVDWDISAATSEQLSNIYVYTDDEKQNKLETYKKAKVIYDAIEKAIERIKPRLEDGLKSLIMSEAN